MKKVLSLFILFIFLTAIVSTAAQTDPDDAKCIEDGHKVETRTSEDVSYEVCVFEYSECGLWQYYKEECESEQCGKAEGYWDCEKGCEPPQECCSFEMKCVQGWGFLFKKYFYLIFAWLWIEEEEKAIAYEEEQEASFGKDLKEEGIEF